MKTYMYSKDGDGTKGFAMDLFCAMNKTDHQSMQSCKVVRIAAAGGFKS